MALEYKMLYDTESANPKDNFIIDDESKYNVVNDPLAKLLRKYHIYDALYKKLSDNNIELEMLQNDLPEDEINGFCDYLQLDAGQKLKFRGLMRKLYKEQNPDKNMAMVAILIGDSGVGKSCLVHQYVGNTFKKNINSTTGIDFQCVVEELLDDSTMKIQILDTAGQERFHSLSRSYFRKADCAILCYDATNEKPFSNLEQWRTKIETYCKDKCVVVLVGCKTDKAQNKQIIDSNIDVAENKIEQVKWSQFHPIHLLCCAKTGENVKKVFVTAAELVSEYGQPKTQKKQEIFVGDVQQRTENGCCSFAS